MKTAQINFRVRPELKEEFERATYKDGLEVTEALTFFMEHYVKKSRENEKGG
jgi:antitoxin component of RelBE/YafQ-DinJ toxin-antitoxin module